MKQAFAAGADVGDFSHSRKLFIDIIKAANCYIDKELQKFLSTPMPNTGMLPHVYITADKSTNHRFQNLIKAILPVVEGKRKAVPLSLKPVYINADGTGGNVIELAEKIFEDLEERTGISRDSERLSQIQGRVFDGQYLCEPFTTKKMNQPITKFLGKDPLMCSELWWLLQWDPVHLIDLVFTAHKEDEFISRLIQRGGIQQRN